jgi:peroxiredoxin
MRILALFLTLTAGFALAEAPPPPRPSPEFVLNMQGGKQELLSKQRGKVVLVEFLFTTCPHCQHTAQVLSKLQGELGPKGFQAIGVAFNEMSSMLVPDFVKNYGATFPVAWANRDNVLTYLSVSPMERFVVPQIVVIDRKGMIRAQSAPLGDPNLQDEAYLRKLIEGLLKEGAGPAAPAKPVTAAPAKKPAVASASASGSGAGAMATKTPAAKK